MEYTFEEYTDMPSVFEKADCNVARTISFLKFCVINLFVLLDTGKRYKVMFTTLRRRAKKGNTLKGYLCAFSTYYFYIVCEFDDRNIFYDFANDSAIEFELVTMSQSQFDFNKFVTANLKKIAFSKFKNVVLLILEAVRQHRLLKDTTQKEVEDIIKVLQHPFPINQIEDVIADIQSHCGVTLLQNVCDELHEQLTPSTYSRSSLTSLPDPFHEVMDISCTCHDIQNTQVCLEHVGCETVPDVNVKSVESSTADDLSGPVDAACDILQEPDEECGEEDKQPDVENFDGFESSANWDSNTLPPQFNDPIDLDELINNHLNDI
ncbi:hypothetical protein RN001_005127 [Aquatica leii]|uniref:Uncharacterized protein n=1 Tax=Aquatica leii TaxID=1421715 RepID=A0AAN7QK05_9COLE|nr:hypothetical protein RN001_005127 [Aquatica leii]